METKEWDLKEGEIIIPPTETPPPPPRYAISLQIVSVEKPWAYEGVSQGQELPIEEALENPKSGKSNEAKLPSEKAPEGKPYVEKSAPTKDGASKKITKDTVKENAREKALATPINNDEQPTSDSPLLSKASFSFQFPGAQLPSMETGMEVGDPIAQEIPPPNVPPPEPVEGDTDLDEPEESLEEPPKPPPDPTTRFLNIPTKEFDVISNYALWHKLLHEPLVITMHWISPTGATRVPFAQARIDLFPVLALKGGNLECSCKLEKIPEPPAPVEDEKASKSKKGAKGNPKEKVPKEDKDTKKKKGKKDEPEIPKEEAPPLLEGSEMKISLSTTNPLWSDDDILHGVVVEYNIGTLRNLPQKVVELGLKSKLPDKKDNKDTKSTKSGKGTKDAKDVKGSKNNMTEDPFNYTLALELPGFFGLQWWDETQSLTPEERVAISQIRLEGGKVEMEEMIPIPEKKKSIIPPQGSIEEALRLHRKAEEERSVREAMTWELVMADQAKKRLQKMEHDHLMNRLLQSETSLSLPSPKEDSNETKKDPLALEAASGPKLEPESVVKWANQLVLKRFLPGRATRELKDLVKLGHQFRGEVARVTSPSTQLQDTSFDKYHGCFFLDLSPFLEEGCWSYDLKTSIQRYSLAGTRAGIPLIQQTTASDKELSLVPAKPGSPRSNRADSPRGKPASPKGKPTSPKAGEKKQLTKVTPIMDDDPPLPVSVDPNNPLPNNAWEASNAVLDIKIKTSKPMEPFWEAPPEPDMSLEDVLPPRPKQASVYDAIQMAMDKFAEFVEYVGRDLLDMYQDLTAKEDFEERNETEDNTAPHKRRFETRGEIRKKMVLQLKKQGLWNDIREEMKTKVLKVAAEKYRERKRNANDIGKFEFCNNLYICLSEVAFNTLKKMLEKRKHKKAEVIDNLSQLRQYADEYEAEEDYNSANRCHQERLLGDNLYDADIWFEYGCFCMRTRPQNQGKAEECWREALSLKKNHLFSLQALGCLMWHRGYMTQAEVLFRNAINLHPEEEHINWVLLSQVFEEEGKKDNARSCLKRAETLYFALRDSLNSYSPPHQLLSPLWRFPFSISYHSLSAQKTSGLFVDTAMLLLDLHLPKEAELILGMEVEIYTCTLDNKWCRARIAELNGNLEQAQNFFKEAEKIDKEDSTTWLLKGHMLYGYDPPAHYTDVLQNSLYKNAIDAFKQYQRFLEEEEEYYIFAYLELGYSHFKLGASDKARKIFLKGCSTVPTSPALWLAAGIAYFHVGDLEHAELALMEGNVLDPFNFKIWGYLTLTCIRMERHEEAEVSFQQGLKCIVDPDLLVTIAEGFARLGNFRDAEIAYLESLKVKEVAGVRFQLAEMYFKQGKYPFATECYETVVKAPDVSLEDKSVSISRLTEMQPDDGPDAPINRHLKDLPVEI